MLIGLSGEMGAGKTALAYLICEHYRYMRMSFAARFKKSLCVLLNWDESKVDDFEYKQEIDPVLGISRRLVMQTFATDFLRDMIHPDIHIRLTAIEAYNYMFLHRKCVVIDDIRQPNEAKFVKDMGGVVIRIIRPENPLPQSDHKVERQITPYDYIVHNLGEPENMLTRIPLHHLEISKATISQLLDSILEYQRDWAKDTVQK